MVWVHAVNCGAGTLYIPTLREIPKHLHDQPLDENVLALARRRIAKVKPRIAPSVDISGPYPTGQKGAAKDVRFHKPQPFGRNLLQSFWAKERAYFGNGHFVGDPKAITGEFTGEWLSAHHQWGFSVFRVFSPYAEVSALCSF